MTKQKACKFAIGDRVVRLVEQANSSVPIFSVGTIAELSHPTPTMVTVKFDCYFREVDCLVYKLEHESVFNSPLYQALS